MRVGLITTDWNVHRCGVAEYSRMLIENLRVVAPDIEVTPIFQPYDFWSLHPRVMAGNYDVIHFNYDSGFLGIFGAGIAEKFRAGGAKIMLTLCDHHDKNNREIFPFTNDFDRIIVHQQTPDGFTFIPIGIDVLENSPWSESNTTIGTAGFPLAQKRPLEVAATAAILVRETPRITGCTMVCPISQHIDTHEIGRQNKQIFPSVNYITDWLPQMEVSRILASNLVNVYPMSDGKSGISASVRMGIATGSYMVLTKCLMFADLYQNEKYREEIEWVEQNPTPRSLADGVLRVLENKKRPKKILEDLNWKNSAQKYADVYRSLVEKAVSA